MVCFLFILVYLLKLFVNIEEKFMIRFYIRYVPYVKGPTSFDILLKYIYVRLSINILD